MLEFLGLTLHQGTLHQLERYGDWLRDEASQAGLLGPAERDRIWERHIVDSLLFLSALPSRLNAQISVLDVGSGSGLPGIPLGIVRPDWQITLCERMQRRADLLHRIVAILDLQNVRVVNGDATRLSGGWSVLVTRATLSLEMMVGLCERLLEPEGCAVAAWSAGGPRPDVEAPQIGSWALRLHVPPSDILDPPRRFLIMTRL